MSDSSQRIAVVGLGYVGLPLALAFAEHGDVVGVDIDSERVRDIQNNEDKTGQVSADELQAALSLQCYDDISKARECNVFIITAPTPVDANNAPDLSFVVAVSEAVGGVLKRGDLVIYESTVCPGTTDEVCIPILQNQSGLRINESFACGYSPERVSPSDKELSDIVKVVSASNDDALEKVAALYEKIIAAGVHRAPSIKVAEAAKITENIQRDVDIAITNELAMVYSQMGISSEAVFDAAATKWNFRRFRPGFVGGHCIGTDSYYLLDKAKREQYAMPLLAAARTVNNNMPLFIAQQVLHDFKEEGRDFLNLNASVLIMGFTFKENCPDVRHTLIAKLRHTLGAAGCRVRVCDPIADVDKTQKHYGVRLETDIKESLAKPADAVIFAVAHQCFKDIPPDLLTAHRVYDVKGATAADASTHWRL